MHPKNLTSFVQMGYVEPRRASFAPSINIAEEEVEDCSQKEYVQIVQDLYANKKSASSRKLGAIKTKVGRADLLEVTMQKGSFTVKMLQCILVRKGKAHIMTGACLDKEWSALRPAFVEAFRSFKVVEDLLEDLSDPSRKEKIEKTLQTLASILQDPSFPQKAKEDKVLEFHAHLAKECKEQGSYWHYLVVQKLHTMLAG